MIRLTQIGFVSCGFWLSTDKGIYCDLRCFTEQRNILYAFIEADKVRYVGKSIQTLRKRMYGYERPQESQSTNLRVHKRIKTALESGHTVDILVMPTPDYIQIGEFRLNLAAALEDSIIEKLCPAWNGGKKGEPIMPDPPSLPIAQFSISLEQTYWNQGFFNVPKDASDLFGSDGDAIEIFYGNSPSPIKSLINRRANMNATPRIYGGKELKVWFRSFPQGTILTVEVMSPKVVKLMVHRVTPPS